MPIPVQEHDDALLYALKSGKTTFDAELLRVLRRIADALEEQKPRRKTDA